MSRKHAKPAVVAFKVEEELAEILNKLPNKSAFIRKAIVAHLGLTCPLCNGHGVVPRGLHDHYASLVQKYNARPCEKCGDEQKLPQDADELSAEARARLEQFLAGGPLYCDGCYVKVPECGECGWHIDETAAAKHAEQAHHSEN